MKRDPFPMKYMLACDFADGSVFVGETVDPKLYVRAIMREWRSTEKPVVRVVSKFRDIANNGRGYDIHGKYLGRYRAVVAGKLIRARGLDVGGSLRTYSIPFHDFHADVIEAAGSIAWGCGDLLMIDGLTSLPTEAVAETVAEAEAEAEAGTGAGARSPWFRSPAVLAGGLGLAVGALLLSRRSRR